MKDHTEGPTDQREKCFNACPCWAPEGRSECRLGVIGSDWRDSTGEPIECECGSYTRDIEFVNRISVMQLHAGRRKGMTVIFLPRMVAVFVFACLLLQNGRSTFAAFTTGNVKFVLLRYLLNRKHK